MEEWVEENFDWQVQGPLEFLEFLKRGQLEGVQFPCYTVRGVHRGWIQEADIPGLLAVSQTALWFPLQFGQAVPPSLTSSGARGRPSSPTRVRPNGPTWGRPSGPT